METMGRTGDTADHLDLVEPATRRDDAGEPSPRPASCEVSVIIPCLDEAETIGTVVAKARSYLESHGVAGEVIVADNGSTDGSQRIAESAGARVVTVDQRGYGAAIKGGIDAARGRYVIMGDADDSYDFTELDGFVERLRAGDDLVMGNRFKGGIMPDAMPFLHRYLGNPVLSWIGRAMFQAPIGDFHCGLRGFRRDSIGRLHLMTPGMEFASEMVVKAALQRLKISEVPTVLRRDGRSRPPHLRTWRDGWRHLRFLLMLNPRWLFLYPGCALMLLGLTTMLWLLPGQRAVGGVNFDIHTLVYSGAAVVLGFQAVAFALLATVWGTNTGLFPRDRRVDSLVRTLTLEVCILVGLALFLLGLGASVFALAFWQSEAFGRLDPAFSMRIVIPSATAMIVGLQLIFSGFFLLLLGHHAR